MSLKYDVECECDECGDGIYNDENIICYKCYRELENTIKKLEAEIERLKEEIKELEE